MRGLKYGANDFDIPWEDEVTQLAGALIEQDIERVLSYARDEGFKTVLSPRCPQAYGCIGISSSVRARYDLARVLASFVQYESNRATPKLKGLGDGNFFGVLEYVLGLRRRYTANR